MGLAASSGGGVSRGGTGGREGAGTCGNDSLFAGMDSNSFLSSCSFLVSGPSFGSVTSGYDRG